MKILQVNSVCGIGSTGRITLEIARRIREEGGDSLIAYGRGRAPDDVNALRIGSDIEVNLHGALSRITDRHGFYSKHATRTFLQQADEYEPDLIQLHNLHGYYLHIGELFRWLEQRKKPVVWTLHDCWAFTGHCAHFDYINCQKWRAGCENCPQKGEYPTSYLKDASRQNYQDKKRLFTSISNMALVTPSQWLADRVKESFLGDYPVGVIPNGIDLDVFRPTVGKLRQSLGLENRIVLLGVANVWGTRKGLDWFIRLAGLLDERYKIVLVGIDDKTDLPDNIIKISRTQNIRQLAELYTMADLYINPSMEETMGMTTVEALACGTPVLAFRATAVPEAIDASCGFVVEKGDGETFERVITSGAFLKLDPQACIRKAAGYDRKKIYPIYTELYRKIMEGSTP